MNSNLTKACSLAEEKLVILTKLVNISGKGELLFGFNEWIKVQDGKPKS